MLKLLTSSQDTDEIAHIETEPNFALRRLDHHSAHLKTEVAHNDCQEVYI